MEKQEKKIFTFSSFYQFLDRLVSETKWLTKSGLIELAIIFIPTVHVRNTQLTLHCFWFWCHTHSIWLYFYTILSKQSENKVEFINIFCFSLNLTFWHFVTTHPQSCPLKCQRMAGWITCDFASFSTVFQSYQDNERLIMKGCVQWNPVYSWEDFASSRARTYNR